MALAQDAADVSGELSGSGGADSGTTGRETCTETEGTQEEGAETLLGDTTTTKNECQTEPRALAVTQQQSDHLESTTGDRSSCDLNINNTNPPQCLGMGDESLNAKPTKSNQAEPDCDVAIKYTASTSATKTTTGNDATKTNASSVVTDATRTIEDNDAAENSAGKASTNATKTNASNTVDTSTTLSKPPAEPTKSALDKELEALLSLGTTDPPPHDILMIQSEHNGTVDIVKAETSLEDPNEREGKGPPPQLRPATTWTSANLREFKHRMANEKHGLLTIRRGEVVTVRVPTHPDGKRLCWEFATDDYDIGFGIYFDWTPVTSTAVTLQVSESSDDEEEEDTESPWHSREGDVERGSVYRLRSRYGEIMQVYRRDSHREVQAGSHEYPGEGVYLLKLDNSYSLLRNKTLYFHVYYSS
ncbi:protein TMED8 [Leptodactylus fuscus]|uniref:protein TMED8 n=1 Tax=Leptodactylus fuscus TaxID=238119 RepID=UPI003F4EB1EC